MALRQIEIRTAYTGERAAALAGVPKSTLHYWARTGVLIPSASQLKVKLWSCEDLMSLRIIDWLRRAKGDAQGREIGRTSMRIIRIALNKLRSLKQEPWTAQEGSPIRVDRTGMVYLQQSNQLTDLGDQAVMGQVLDPLAPFEGEGTIKGPDLRRPRFHLRIVPGKLAGEPHILDTRIETRALAALAGRGFGLDEILAMYPFVTRPQLEEALDLEHQLASNLAAA